MVLRVAGSFLRKAICHIQTDYRYRYYPLYAAGFAGLFYVWWIWPWDRNFIEVLRMYPWIYDLNLLVVDVVCSMIVCLGIVGFFRRGLPAKVLSIGALYMTTLWWDPVLNVSRLGSDILWYTFDVPAKYISGIAGIETGGSTLLWCGYFLVAYILVRPLLKRAYRGVKEAARFLVELYPPLARLEKPVL